MDANGIHAELVSQPARTLIIRRGKTAHDYFSYCEDVGCDIWTVLSELALDDSEPVCLWLPPHMQTPGTSEYVQGVEVPSGFDAHVPAGFDLIELPAALYLKFQGPPFDDEDYACAIGNVWDAIDGFDPSACGCVWDDANPRMQLEPIGSRGYIEYVPVRRTRHNDRDSHN